MTMMDSDSESQDSDEGRRFRFEATRKDSAATVLHRNKGFPFSKEESPSRRRNYPNRSKDNDECSKKTLEEKDLNSGRSRESSSSRDRLKEPLKYASDSANSKSKHKDSRNSSDHRDFADNSLRSFEYKSKHRESKSNRDSKYLKTQDLKDCRHHHGRKRRPSEERYRDRSHDEKSLNRDRHRYHSREKEDKNRQKSRSSDSSRSRDYEIYQKSGKKDSDGSNSRKTTGCSPLSKSEETTRERQECMELNLSDFDVVSDTEEILSDDSHSNFEKCLDRNDELSKKDSAKSIKQQSEESDQVNSKSSTYPQGTSNNISGTVSDLPQESMFAVASKACDERESKLRSFPKRKRDSDKGTPEEAQDHHLETTDSRYGPVRPINSQEPSRKANTSSRCLEMDTDSKVPLSDEESEDFYGPSLPAKSNSGPARMDRPIIGPTLPRNLAPSENSEDSDMAFGPALPPHLTREDHGNSKTSSTIGPMLPSLDGRSLDITGSSNAASESDEDILGPLPADHPAARNSYVQEQLARRALRIQAEFREGNSVDTNKREEWMTELPPAQSVSLGLGPRKFRIREGPDMSDRSSWTDTPADKARKLREMAEGKNVDPKPEMQRLEAEKVLKDSSHERKSKKQEKSLLEMHQKKMQKKRKKEEKEAKKLGELSVRRPFDRDIDLQANRFDDAQKKSIFMKSQFLNDRFCPGKI